MVKWLCINESDHLLCCATRESEKQNNKCAMPCQAPNVSRFGSVFPFIGERVQMANLSVNIYSYYH